MSRHGSDPMDSVYSGRIAGAVAGGHPRAKRKINYPCPKCGAVAGQRCQRFKSGVDYWEPITGFHRERKVTNR